MMTLHVLVEFLERTIFGNKLITDHRTIDNDSVFTFDIPSSSFSSSSSLSDIRMFLFETGGGGDGDGDVGAQPEMITTITCGVLLPYFGFYYQLIVILMIQNIFNYILGSFVYKIVIEPRQERQRQQQQQQTAREKISHKNDNDDDVDNDDNDNGDRDRDDDGDIDDNISTTTMATTSLLLSSTSLSSTSTSSSSSLSLSSLLFAFGVALPAVILEPIYAIQILKIQNVGLIMVFLATPIVNSLRIFEAVYDYIPFQQQQQKHDNKLKQQYPSRSISYWNYIIYFSCPFGIEFNNSTGQPKQILSSKSNNNNNNNHYYSYCQKRWRVVNSDYYKKRLLLLGRDFIIVSFLISVLKEYNYELFQVKKDHQQQQQDYYYYYSSIKDLFFSWQHIGNNFLVACLLSTSLSQSSLGISLLYSLCWGYECYEMVLNPMFKSTSVSDFWGKRWNLLVHRGLKNGIYKPILLRRHHQHHDITTTCSNQILSSSLSSSPPLSLSDKIVASGATFLVSGIIHEYVMLIMVSFGNHSNQYNQHDQHQHQHQHQHDQQLYRFTWKQILFFGWNGILIALEYLYCFCRSNCTTTITTTIFNTLFSRRLRLRLRLRRQGLRLRVPKIIVTAFVLYSALPVAHLFTGDYIRYGFFDAVSIAEPIINCKRIAVDR